MKNAEMPDFAASILEGLKTLSEKLDDGIEAGKNVALAVAVRLIAIGAAV